MRAESPDNVADLIAKPPEVFTPEPRYVSKYRDKVIEASKRGKSAHKTFGVPSYLADSPARYLKKHSASAPGKPLSQHRHYRRPGYQRKLPEWKPVKASELLTRLNKNRIDFAERNVEDTMNLRPRRPRMYCVDDRFGHAYPLIRSGMFPYYRNKKGYGHVPGKVPPLATRRAKPRAKSDPQSDVDVDAKLRGAKKRNMSPGRRSPRHGSPGRASPGRGSPRHKSPVRGSPRRGPVGVTKNKATLPKRGIQSPRRGAAASPRREAKAKDDKPKMKKREAPKGRENRTKRTEPKKETERSSGSGAERGDSSRSPSEGGPDETKAETIKIKSEPLNDEEETKEDEKSDVTSTKSRITSAKSDSRSSKSKVGSSKSEIRSSKSEIGSSKSEKPQRPASTEYQQPRCRYVTQDEREELLYGMKKKWDEMMKEFQCLPFLTDTAPKVKRKSRMEKALLQLEKDIETIERHPYIYVYSDSED